MRSKYLLMVSPEKWTPSQTAESLNAKIKDFRAQLRGVIDKKFFIFRLVKIFG